LAAFLAFTLPSAALLVAFAAGASLFQGPIGTGILAGLKIVAVAIVAQAVWGMAKALTPDRERASIAVAAALAVILLAGSLGQVLAILLGALAGLVFCRAGTGEVTGTMRFPVSRTAGAVCLALFLVLLLGLPVVALATGSAGVVLFDAFYRAGALVFGGGHVVLPLLQAGVVNPGWVTSEQFLAGYGAAQAVPGPLFTFAAYLGTLSGVGPGGVAGAAVALAGIFLPGFLLLGGVLPFWDRVRSRPQAQALMRGANAAVVGILAAALYNPVFTTAITGPGPFCLGLVCFVLLIAWKAPPWAVVLVGAAGGVLLALIG
jgi:chromate transporter